MREIKFSYNWNNKLDCKAFTTLRLHNPNKYKKGEEYKVFLKEEELVPVVIAGIRVIPFKDINDYIARLDTGYSLEECRKIIKRMFKHVEDDTLFDFILLARGK